MRAFPLSAVTAIAAVLFAMPASADSPQSKPQPGSPARSAPVVFTRYIDQSEGAFLVLVPKGWQTRGGMLRVNPLTAVGGVGNSIVTKIDFAILREPEGRVAIRWLPAISYAQPSPYTAAVGGNWNGMPVVAMPRAADYLTRILFPQLRPGARGVRVVETKQRPDAVAAVEQLPVARTMRSQGAYYVADAAEVTVTYEEAGVRYREFLFVAVEGYNMMGAALWSNPFTIAARAPEAESDTYARMAKTVVNSFALNPLWLQAESQGQIHRGNVAADTLRDIARIDAEIARSRSETMSKINSEQYLAVTGQERYINPHTGQEELGSSEWKCRWENSFGEVIYADDTSWDPALEAELASKGYKRSQVVQR